MSAFDAFPRPIQPGPGGSFNEQRGLEHSLAQASSEAASCCNRFRSSVSSRQRCCSSRSRRSAWWGCGLHAACQIMAPLQSRRLLDEFRKRNCSWSSLGRHMVLSTPIAGKLPAPQWRAKNATANKEQIIRIAEPFQIQQAPEHVGPMDI